MIESPKFPPSSVFDYWKDKISSATRYNDGYFRKITEIKKRYLLENRMSLSEDMAGPLPPQFNILWSNIQTLLPAVFSEEPQVAAVRRYNAKNTAARDASTILERLCAYQIDKQKYFFTNAESSVKDFLLYGKGITWLTYHYEQETLDDKIFVYQVGDGFVDENLNPVVLPSGVNVQGDELTGHYYNPVRIAAQLVKLESVPAGDFLIDPSATSWENVSWVARRLWLSEEEVEEIGKQGDFALGPKKEADNQTTIRENSSEQPSVAPVWEIWCKRSKTVKYFSESKHDFIAVINDPLQLEDFFPCARPMLATTNTGSLDVVPDYLQYKDLADQLDLVTKRRSGLINALKVAGAYDSSFPDLRNLINTVAETGFIPVDGWGRLKDAGGLSGAMDFLPLKEYVQGIAAATQEANLLIETIYQVSGVSDILRGSTAASETATAQRIKGQFATLRLNRYRKEVNNHFGEVANLMVEILANRLDEKSLHEMVGSDFIIAPSEEEKYKRYQDAYALIKDGKHREFQIDIETDSTIVVDEQAEKQQAIEFLQIVGTSLDKAVPAIMQNPIFGRVYGELLMHTTRKFRSGSNIEASIESALDQMELMRQQPQPPSEEQIKMQMEAKQQEFENQLNAQKAESKAMLEKREQDMTYELRSKELEIQQQKVEIAALKAHVDLAKAQSDNSQAEMERVVAASESAKPAPAPAAMPTIINAAHDQPIVINPPLPPVKTKIARITTAPNGDRIAVLEEVPEEQPIQNDMVA